MGLLSSIFGFGQLIVIASLLSELSPIATSQPISNTKREFSHPASFPVQYMSGRPEAGVSVPAIAQQVTVRILTNEGAGSGAIVQRRGRTYTVLTCAHVVDGISDNRYTILTADGNSHSARWLRSIEFGDTDLALVQFTSDRSYRVVVMGDSNALSVGDTVYASGFPNWISVNSRFPVDTHNWGLRAYRLTTGRVGMLSARSLERGYKLGYTNDVENGMSGGPVLDRNGRLIGINGRLKYALADIGAYTFADGTVPSEVLFRQMEALSWAIPIATFQQKVGRF